MSGICGGRRVPLKGPPQAAAPHESKVPPPPERVRWARHRADCFAPVGAPQRALAPTSRLAGGPSAPRGTNGPRRAKRDLPNTELPMQCTVNGVTSVPQTTDFPSGATVTIFWDIWIYGEQVCLRNSLSLLVILESLWYFISCLVKL